MAHIDIDSIDNLVNNSGRTKHIVLENWNDYQKRKREERNFNNRLTAWKVKFWLWCFAEISLFVSYIGTNNVILGILTLSFFICGFIWVMLEGHKIENPNEDIIVESFKSLYS